jgi:chemotaxis protein MotA
MDLASVIGMTIGFGLVLWALGANFMAFVDIPSIMIVVGGTIGATLLHYPLQEVLRVINVSKKAFLHKEESPADLIKTLVKFAETARREGILSLEQAAMQINDDFLKNGITLAVDGTEPDYIREIMTTEMDNIAERHKNGAAIMEAMGAYAPAFGMIGTLIGLVIMLRNMNDPSSIGSGMAVALITTFYGAVLANLVFLPIAGKLKLRSAHELLMKELCIQGIMAIQSGDNPRIVESKLKAFLSPSKRTEFKRDE